MWIGNSLLFNWLDRNLEKAGALPRLSQGKIYMVHSGAFYDVERDSRWNANNRRNILSGDPKTIVDERLTEASLKTSIKTWIDESLTTSRAWWRALDAVANHRSRSACWA